MIRRQQQRPPVGRRADPLDPDSEKRAGGAVIEMRDHPAAADPDRDPLRRNPGEDQRDQRPGAQGSDQLFSFTSSDSGTA